MMVRPRIVPKVAKAVVPTAMPQACARRVSAAELPTPSTAAITSSGIAALVKPVAKWTVEASAKVTLSAAIAIPVLRLGVRRRRRSACGVDVMVGPYGLVWLSRAGWVVRQWSPDRLGTGSGGKERPRRRAVPGAARCRLGAVRAASARRLAVLPGFSASAACTGGPVMGGRR